MPILPIYPTRRDNRRGQRWHRGSGEGDCKGVDGRGIQEDYSGLGITGIADVREDWLGHGNGSLSFTPNPDCPKMHFTSIKTWVEWRKWILRASWRVGFEVGLLAHSRTGPSGSRCFIWRPPKSNTKKERESLSPSWW